MKLNCILKVTLPSKNALAFIFLLVFLFTGARVFLQTENNIDSSIRKNYYTDCEMLVRHFVINKQGRFLDSITMPKQEVEFFLRLMTAVYKSDSTVFSKKLFYFSTPRHSRLEVMFDAEQKWVKKLFASNGITKNKEYNALLAQYNFDVEMLDTGRWVIAYRSEKILNLIPLAIQLRQIEGVISTFEFALIRTPYTNYDWINNILELKFYDPLTEGEESRLPDIYWKYKVTNDRVNLISYKNQLVNRNETVEQDLSEQLYACKQHDLFIDPWIKQNYEHDCEAMVRKFFIFNSNLFRDSIYMPRNEVNLFLALLTAVNEVNDSLFKKYEFHNARDLNSAFYLSFDQKLPWVKTLFKTKGITGNERFDAIIDQYRFTCVELHASESMARFQSTEILNVSPIVKMLYQIEGIEPAYVDELIVWSRIKFRFDPDKKTFEFFHFSDRRADSDWDIKPTIYWKYKIENCKPILMEFYDMSI